MNVLLDVLGSVWWMIVAIGVLVTFHEFGHFIVARRLGVKVLRFSVGFGKPLWSRFGRDDTEYAVAAIPLGGYVKMLDEREGEVPPEQRHRAFNTQKLWKRFAIVAAGPVFNLVFTLLAFWVMFMVGVTDLRPVVGQVSGIAAEAGLKPQQQIVAVDGHRTASWTEVVIELVGRALDHEPTRITVSGDGGENNLVLPLDELAGKVDEDHLLESIGIQPWRPKLEPVVGEVTAGGAADRAGVRVDDRIVALDGKPIERWNELQDAVEKAGRAGNALTLTLSRDGAHREVAVTPEMTETPGGERYRIGIAARPLPPETLKRFLAKRQYGPLAAVSQSFSETGRLATTTLGMLGRMVTGAASTSGLSGPITIARYANEAAQMGLSRFLYFLALLSLSLAILNLLPIPILDGGHLLYYLIEFFTGSPVSERVQIAGQYVGLALLAGLMGLAFYNDILRLFSS